MKRTMLSLLLLAALGSLASAQVSTGYYGDGAGNSVKVEVSDTNGAGTPGVEVTVTDAGGSGLDAKATQGSGSTDTKPTASGSHEITTPRGSETYKVENGAFKRKNADGTWKSWKRVNPPKRTSRSGR
jgi:hypothetical protein